MTDLRRSLLDRAKGYEQEAAKAQGTLSAYWRGMAHGLSMAADMQHRAGVSDFMREVAEKGVRKVGASEAEHAG
jgi:hypothetical protein